MRSEQRGKTAERSRPAGLSSETRELFPVAEAGQSHFTGFRFLSVKTTRTSVQLAWTWAGSGTRYLVFAQEIYGVYFTERSRFELVGLEPRKTYHVFVLAEGRGPEWIAFTSFETLE